jgi:hypothetical protein
MKKLALTAIISLELAVSAFGADITQMPGWPKTVSGNATFANMGGLVLADIDGDGDLEVILGTTAQQLHAWEYDGSEIFTQSLTGLAQSPAAVGDVTGDALPEIVVSTRKGIGGTPIPEVHVFSGAGVLLHHAPMAHNGSLMEAPTLADLDDDGKLEIIVGEEGSSTGWLYALNGDLTPLSGWPVTLDHVPATSAAVGDIDHDGAPEIVVCSYYSVYAFETNGAAMSGFPVTIGGEAYSYGSPALADLDGDDKLEIITTTHGDHNRIHAIRYDGSELSGWPYDLGDAWSYAPPSVGDIDGDGSLEVAVGRSGGMVADDALFVITHDGDDFGAFPYSMEGGAEGQIVLADFTGDDRLEIVFTNNLADAGAGCLLAVDADAQPLDGWPLRPAGFTYLNGATLGDVDGDGTPEFGVIGAKNDATVSVNLYTSDDYFFGPGGVHWRTYQANDAHTGLYAPVYPVDDDDDNDDDNDDDAADDDDDNDNDDNDDDAADDDDDNDNDDNDNDDNDEPGNDDDSGDDDDSGGCGC